MNPAESISPSCTADDAERVLVSRPDEIYEESREEREKRKPAARYRLMNRSQPVMIWERTTNPQNVTS